MKIKVTAELDEAKSKARIDGQLKKMRENRMSVDIDASDISKQVEGAIRSAQNTLKSQQIRVPFQIDMGDPDQLKREMNRVVSEMTKGQGQLIKHSVNTNTVFDEELGASYERLSGAMVQYKDELNRVITKQIEFRQIGNETNNDGQSEAIMGWTVAHQKYAHNIEQTIKAEQKLEKQRRTAEANADVLRSVSKGVDLDWSKHDKAFSDGDYDQAIYEIGILRKEYAAISNELPKLFPSNEVEKFTENLGNAITQTQTLRTRFEQLGNKTPEGMTQNLDGLESKYKALTGLPVDQEVAKQYTHLEGELKKATNAYSELQLKMKGERIASRDTKLATDVERARKNLIVLKDEWSAFGKDKALTAEWKGLLDKSSLVESRAELTNLNAEVALFKSKVKEAGLAGKSFLGQFKENVKKFSNWFLIGGGVSSLVRGVKDIYNTVVELNKAFVDLRIASGGSAASTTKLLRSYVSLGKEMGATTTEVASAADSYLRQGKSIAETEELVRTSLILSKVGQIESAQSTEYLTTAMKGYGVEVENTLGIVDKLTAVDAISATSAGGLAEGMAETANNAKMAGVSMDRLLGILATIGEVTGSSMSSTGNAVSSIFSRMGNIKLARLKDYDGTGEDLSNVETVLRGKGIKLRDSANEFRNFSDVLDETASNWKNYDSVSKRAIASAMAGKEHMEDFLVLMDNYGTAIKYSEAAVDSAGSAMSKYEMYMEGIEAKQDKAKASMEAFSIAILDSGIVGGAYDASAGIMGFLTKIVETLHAIPTLAATAAAALSFKNMGKTTMPTNVQLLSTTLA